MTKAFLYYAGFNKETLEEQIGVAVSDDLHFWKYEGDTPIIPIKSEGIYDEKQTSNPCVLKHQGFYKMWYQGRSKEGFISICYAESKDGINWKVSNGSVLHPDLGSNAEYREGFHHPHVIFDEQNNLFKMWCIIYHKGLTSIGYCESVDGVVWGEIRATSLQSFNQDIKYFYPFVLKDGDNYKMWFTEKVGKNWQILFSDSKDGITWNNNYRNYILAPKYNKFIHFFFESLAKSFGIFFKIPLYGIGSPFVWKENNNYYLIGHAVGPRGKLFIPLYSSPDGINWKKVKNNILQKPESEWNNYFQADPYLYVEK